MAGNGNTAAQAPAPAAPEKKKGPFDWFFDFFHPQENDGGGFNFFKMVGDVALWGAILIGLYWIAKKFEPQITEWLNKLNPEWRLGDKFKGLMDNADGLVGKASGGLVGAFGGMFPEQANKMAIDKATKHPDEFKKDLAGYNINGPLADFVTANAPTLIPLIQSAGGDKKLFIGAAFDKDNLPKVLNTLYTQQPGMLKQMLQAALQSAPKGGAPSPKVMEMIGTVLTSQDSQSLRAQIPSMLQGVTAGDASQQAMLQFLGNAKNIEAASAFATAVGPDQFSTLITAFTTKDANGNIVKDSDAMKAVIEAVKDTNYANALQAFAVSVDKATLPDDMKIPIIGIKADPAIALNKFVGALPEPVKADAAAAQPNQAAADAPAGDKAAAPAAPSPQPEPAKIAIDPSQAMDLFLDGKNAASAMGQEDLKTIGEEAKKQLAKAKQEQKAALEFIAYQTNDGTYGNLKAGAAFIAAVRADEKGDMNLHQNVTDPVVHKLIDFISGKQGALQPADAKAIVTFFRIPGNMAAFQTFTGALHSKDKNVDAFLQKLHGIIHHAANKDGGTGLDQILTSETDLAVMIRAMNEKKITLKVMGFSKDVALDGTGNMSQDTQSLALNTSGYHAMGNNIGDVNALNAAAKPLLKPAAQRG